jgi:hypothetical protein
MQRTLVRGISAKEPAHFWHSIFTVGYLWIHNTVYDTKILSLW